MTVSFADFGFDAEPEKAPKKGSVQKKIGAQQQWQKLAAPIVLGELLGDGDCELMLVINELRDEFPDLKPKTNYLSLALTTGVGGRGGLGLYIERGYVLMTRENAWFLYSFLAGQGLLESFYSQYSTDERELVMDIAALPMHTEYRAQRQQDVENTARQIEADLRGDEEKGGENATA